ncbi:hypothetical protein DENSPDRAFT_837644 [Dentipellis sp. KUC8613]|nr:hypothetical protein DENSPDRAFT_837644 [Dentipellis sp. KUC8613]
MITSEKRGELTGYSGGASESLPAYAPPPGPPQQNPGFYQSSGGHGSNDSRGLADSYYAPPSHSPYSSGLSPYPPGHPPQGHYPSPPISQGGSPNPSDMNLAQQFPGFTYTGKAPSKRDPLSPPPSAFARQPNPQCPYPPLPEPIRIPAQDRKTLDKGFIPMFPAPQFLLAHDVQPADLARLLEDCHLMSATSIGQKITANVAPLAMGVGFFPGILISRALENRMKRGNVQDAVGLIEVWDEAFFAPRRLRVALQRGRMSGTTIDKRDDSSSSSSDSDSDSDDDHKPKYSHGTTGQGQAGLGVGVGAGVVDGRAARKAEKRANRDARRAQKRADRDERRAEKKADRAQRKAERRARKEARKTVRRSGGIDGNIDERIYLVISNR